jgi:deoxyribodipyrimidine photolyase-related protein
MTKDKLDVYHQMHPVHTQHHTFFNYVKKCLQILEDTESLDAYNRHSLKSMSVREKIPSFEKSRKKRYYEEAINYTQSMFNDHYGNPKSVYIYPISSKDAYSQFRTFLKQKLPNFGKYQDAILQNYHVLNHSFCSAYLNIGLVDPNILVKLTMNHYEKYKANIELNNLEGFIRQVIGWREYMRFLYMYHYDDMTKSNVPRNNIIPEKSTWYNAKTGILPIDNEIRKAVDIGYAHHIVRLMFFLNFFILNNIHPHFIYTWFMEVVSIDAYDWVMVPNIYAMGYFYPHAMSRPYLCSSNYITKMSDYKRDGKWDVLWDKLYHKFVNTKPKKYTAYYKR